MKKLVLSELLNVKPEERNKFMFDLYRGDKDIKLTGSRTGGILENDILTQDVLCDSGIEIVMGNGEVSILDAGTQLYTVDAVYNSDGGYKEERHLDFNTLREIRDLDNTFAAPIVIGGIISQVYFDTDKERLAKRMYENYSKEDFDPSTDDGRVFNGKLEEVQSLYPEEELHHGGE